MSFELSWNLIKDYLEAQGLTNVKTPRSAFKKAFEIGLIDQGHHWMDLLPDRNLTAHTYEILRSALSIGSAFTSTRKPQCRTALTS